MNAFLFRVTIESDYFLADRDLLYLPLTISCSTVEEVNELFTLFIHYFDAKDEVILFIEANAYLLYGFCVVDCLYFEPIAGSLALVYWRFDLICEVELNLVQSCALERDLLQLDLSSHWKCFKILCCWELNVVFDFLVSKDGEFCQFRSKGL